MLHTFIQSWEQGRGNIPACATSIWFNSTSQVVNIREDINKMGTVVFCRCVNSESSGIETCPSCVTIALCLSWHGVPTSPRFDLLEWLQNKCAGSRVRDGQMKSEGLDGQLPRSPVPQLSVSPWLCTCVLLTAHAPLSRAVSPQPSAGPDWLLPYTTPLATLGDRRTILHWDIQSRKQQNNASFKARTAVKILPTGPRGRGDPVSNIEMRIIDQDLC